MISHYKISNGIKLLLLNVGLMRIALSSACPMLNISNRKLQYE